MSIYLSIYLYVYLSIYMSIYLSIYLFIYLSIHDLLWFDISEPDFPYLKHRNYHHHYFYISHILFYTKYHNVFSIFFKNIYLRSMDKLRKIINFKNDPFRSFFLNCLKDQTLSVHKLNFHPSISLGFSQNDRSVKPFVRYI